MDPTAEWRRKLRPLADSAGMTAAFRARLRTALEEGTPPRRPLPAPRRWNVPATAAGLATIAAALFLPGGALSGGRASEALPPPSVAAPSAPTFFHQEAVSSLPLIFRHGAAYRPATPASAALPANVSLRGAGRRDWVYAFPLTLRFKGASYRIVSPDPVRPGARIGKAQGFVVYRLPGRAPAREIAAGRPGYPVLAARPVRGVRGG